MRANEGLWRSVACVSGSSCGPRPLTYSGSGSGDDDDDETGSEKSAKTPWIS